MKKDEIGAYPIRQKYVQLAHPEIEKKSNNPKDIDSYESNARQDKAIYELLGLAYINNKGKIKITEVGKEILINENKRDEIMLRQLLKYQYPNYVNNSS